MWSIFCVFAILKKAINTMAAIISPQLMSTKIILALVLLACYHNSICVRSYLLQAAFSSSI